MNGVHITNSNFYDRLYIKIGWKIISESGVSFDQEYALNDSQKQESWSNHSLDQ